MKTLGASVVCVLLAVVPASLWSHNVPAWIEQLGWTLVHSIWQLAAVALVAALVARGLRRRSANARYVAGVTALGLMLALPGVTWMFVVVEPRVGEPSQIANAPDSLRRAGGVRPPVGGTSLDANPTGGLTPPARQISPEVVGNRSRAESREPLGRAQWGEVQRVDSSKAPAWKRVHVWARAAIEPRLPLLVALWLAGVVLCSLRPVWGLWTQWRLRRVGLSQVSDAVQQRLHDLARRLRLTRVIRIAESTLVRVPIVVGYLRPMILLPASVLSGLTPTQLEAVLAHELAHVRRHDWLVNMLQVLAETLCFFHPAVWWLSNRVRSERELCCDDIALSLIKDKAVFARTLLILEELRQSTFTPALAATGGDLAQRVRRLLPGKTPPKGTASGWLATILALTALATLTLASVRPEIEGKTMQFARESPVIPEWSRTAAPITRAMKQVLEENVPAIDALTDLARDIDRQLPPPNPQKDLPSKRPPQPKADDAAKVEPQNAGTERIFGSVVDHEGRAAKSVRVRVLRAAESEKGEVIEATTDEAGKFELRLLPRRVARAMLVASSGDESRMALHQVPWDRDPKQPAKEIRLELKDSVRVDIEVADAAGQPVAAARVGIIASYNKIAGTTTDAAGRSSLRVPADATIETIYARKPQAGLDYRAYQARPRPDRGLVEPPKLEQPVKLTLTGIRPLSVRVLETPSDKPIGGLRLYPWYVQKPGGVSDLNLSFSANEFSVTTDPEGVAKFDWLPDWDQSNLLQIWPISKEFESQRGTYKYKTGDGTLTMRLARLVPLTGRVTHADGSPAANLRIQGRGEGYAIDGFRGEATTEAEGRYKFLAAPNQIYLLIVADQKWAAAPRTGFAVFPNQPVEGLDFVLRPATRVFGRVTVGPDKTPVANQHISVYQ